MGIVFFDVESSAWAAIGAGADRINLKATNSEGLGALGRGEGMAAAAVVLLESA